VTRGRPEGGRVDSAAKALTPKLESVRAELTEVHSHADQISEHFPVRIYNQLLTLNDMVQSADAAPTQGQLDSFRELAAQTARRLARLREVERTDLAAFNAMMKQLDVLAVVVPAPARPDATPPSALP
jgi:SpoVK/Ycf46/Vps4 family AAA+-type ATPase